MVATVEPQLTPHRGTKLLQGKLLGIGAGRKVPKEEMRTKPTIITRALVEQQAVEQAVTSLLMTLLPYLYVG